MIVTEFALGGERALTLWVGACDHGVAVDATVQSTQTEWACEQVDLKERSRVLYDVAFD